MEKIKTITLPYNLLCNPNLNKSEITIFATIKIFSYELDILPFGRTCRKSIEEIAKEANLSWRGTTYAINKLEKEGYIIKLQISKNKKWIYIPNKIINGDFSPSKENIMTNYLPRVKEAIKNKNKIK